MFISKNVTSIISHTESGLIDNNLLLHTSSRGYKVLSRVKILKIKIKITHTPAQVLTFNDIHWKIGAQL